MRRATKGAAFGNRELLKKLDQNFLTGFAENLKFSESRQQLNFIAATSGVRGPRASRLVTSKVSPRGADATLIIKNFPRVGYTLAFLKKSGVGQHNKSIWLKSFAGEFEGEPFQRLPLI